MANKEAIKAGNTSLGIEFGSTRIKAVLVDEKNEVLAIGSHEWEKPIRERYLDLFTGRYLERTAGLLQEYGRRCQSTVR